MNTAQSFSIQQSCLQVPTVRGVIERRMLVNFRCEPAVLARWLPAPFRPKLVNGWGVAGICLIRLGGMHPAFLPVSCGLTSENAAHRVAVEWGEGDEAREGVFIPRRDTNALFNRLVGGTIFPGIHHAAEFVVNETADRFELEMRSRDQNGFVQVQARLAEQLPADSIFGTLERASEFFRGGSLGWSARSMSGSFDGLELLCDEWQMEPLAVETVRSSFFENIETFPRGTVEFDSAFLMRNIAHEWQARGKLSVKQEATL